MSNNVTEATRDKVNEIFSILEGVTNENAFFIIATVLGYLLRDEDDDIVEFSLELVNSFVRNSHDILKELPEEAVQ